MQVLKKMHKAQKNMTGKALAVLLSFALVSSLSAWPIYAFADATTESPAATEQPVVGIATVTETSNANKPVDAAANVEKKNEATISNADVKSEEPKAKDVADANGTSNGISAQSEEEADLDTEVEAESVTEVYVYAQVDDNTNKDGLVLNGDNGKFGGWYTLGKLRVPGLISAQEANDNKIVKPRTYSTDESLLETVLKAIENPSYFTPWESNQSIDLNHVKWKASGKEVGLKLEFSARNYRPNNSEPTWHLDGWVETITEKDPTDPVNPTNPSDDPTPTPDPEQPTPDNPVNPTPPEEDPTDPIVPPGSTDPTNPSDPTDPTIPADNPTPTVTPTDPGVTPIVPTVPTTPVVPTPTAGTTPVIPAVPVTPAIPATPAAGTTPAAPATPADGTVAPVVAVPAADGAVTIADDATPLAAPDEATIADDATPLAAPEAPQCWVHILMIIGIILTAIYGVAVALRRLGYARKVNELDQDITGTKPPVKPVLRVQRVMQHA